MKTKLLLITILIAFGLQAQTTHDLIWERGFESPEADLTIDVGDTVRWTWTDAVPHTVENNTGSTENFNSGVLTGLGQTYSYTFTLEGANPYFCGIHGAGNMSGIITVQQGLSVEEFSSSKLVMYPNPVSSELQIELSSNINEGTITIINVMGRQVLKQFIDKGVNKLTMDVSNLLSGMYFIRYEFGDQLEIKRLIVK